MPFFQELSLFGLRFTQTIDDLKSHVAEQMNNLRSDIRNSIGINTQISPQFNLPVPPPDSQLPALEERIRRVITVELHRRGVQPPPSRELERVDDDVAAIFAARYQIERELRRLASELEYVGQSRQPISRLTEMLVDAKVIEPQLARAIQDVYRVCSSAIHGQLFTQGQRDFVRETAPPLIAALRAIGRSSQSESGS